MGRETEETRRRDDEIEEDSRELEITIYFGGKIWIFKDWKEAREKGFYLG